MASEKLQKDGLELDGRGVELGGRGYCIEGERTYSVYCLQKHFCQVWYGMVFAGFDSPLLCLPVE